MAELKDITNRETEPIRTYGLMYGMGQKWDVDFLLYGVTGLNAAYLVKQFECGDGVLDLLVRKFNAKIERDVAGSWQPVKKVAFSLVEYNSGDLGLFGEVVNADTLDLKLTERGISVSDEAEKWILKYGRDTGSKKKLKSKLKEYFGEDLEKDYNFKQKELMEFFLKNLHLLKK